MKVTTYTMTLEVSYISDNPPTRYQVVDAIKWLLTWIIKRSSSAKILQDISGFSLRLKP